MQEQQRLNQQMLEQQRLNQQRLNQSPNIQIPQQDNQGKYLFEGKLYQFNQGSWTETIGTLTL